MKALISLDGNGNKVRFLRGNDGDIHISFDVPDNDGYLVFTAMDNQTIRKALKLKKGEGIIVSIRKDK